MLFYDIILKNNIYFIYSIKIKYTKRKTEDISSEKEEQPRYISEFVKSLESGEKSEGIKN